MNVCKESGTCLSLRTLSEGIKDASLMSWSRNYKLFYGETDKGAYCYLPES